MEGLSKSEVSGVLKGLNKSEGAGVVEGLSKSEGIGVLKGLNKSEGTGVVKELNKLEAPNKLGGSTTDELNSLVQVCLSDLSNSVSLYITA